MQNLKFVSWWFRFLMSQTGYKREQQIFRDSKFVKTCHKEVKISQSIYLVEKKIVDSDSENS